MVPALLQAIGVLAAIIFIDLTLSGDNALVIGAAASRLHGSRRRMALVVGGGMAIILRITLTLFAALILQLHFVKAVGGVIVLIISVLLLRDIYQSDEPAQEGHKAQVRFLRAVFIILFADLSMSLDNILAIAALANGDYLLLTIGLLVSVLLLMLASAVIARFMERYTWLLYLASGILVWTAGAMIAGDAGLAPWLQQQVPAVSLTYAVPAGLLAIFMIYAILWWRAHRHINLA